MEGRVWDRGRTLSPHRVTSGLVALAGSQKTSPEIWCPVLNPEFCHGLAAGRVCRLAVGSQGCSTLKDLDRGARRVQRRATKAKEQSPDEDHPLANSELAR